ncbi:hypothetical protein ONS95_010721 [Cadophora gregata]|uniref:uncharacterized protein n=1 Tax=Cadophora gregata TaxID=51156 RepID=UPI0026DD8E99|nr:uncharacterized protein ONS95_010721 [Cadophora gregata]KAK0122491.1 hypothetical protein ONS95_010721 [Cadophora gregata]KAK0127969.1 hypothetical protein ONS96_007464 [Cadophora gregata f. sp. sojae]
MVSRIWCLPSPPKPLQNSTSHDCPTSTSPTSPLLPSAALPSDTDSNSASSLDQNIAPSCSSSHTTHTNTSRPYTKPEPKPPPRLHLRALIPSKPLVPSSTNTILIPLPPPPPPPPPSFPFPWIWQCHLCGSVYRLGVTRRCLEDGHFFCAEGRTPVLTPTGQDGNGDGGENGNGGEKRSGRGGSEEKAKRRRGKRRDKKGKKRGRNKKRGCRAEFDYEGWKAWGVCRRRREVWRLYAQRGVGAEEVTMGRWGRGARDEVEVGDRKGDLRDRARESGYMHNPDERGRSRGRSGEGEPAGNTRWDDGNERKNCWLDCDFPSQCHNERRLGKLDEEWMEREWGTAGEVDVPAYEERLDESPHLDVDVNEDVDNHEDQTGSKKRRKLSSVPGEFELEVELGEENKNEVFLAGVGQWNDDHDEDGDTIMTDADVDYESEEGANPWAKFDPISGSRPASYSQTHKIPTGLAISTDNHTAAEERDVAFTISRDDGGGERENLGPIGIDSDGLGEAGYQLSHIRSIRRKSVEGLGGDQSPPGSPLKECSNLIGFEELDGGDLGVRGGGNGGVGVGEGTDAWKNLGLGQRMGVG